MTLPGSGTLALSDIKTEFAGLGGGNNLTDYYRSPGGVVPDTSLNAGVPTSGNISITDFYGASANRVQLVGASLSDQNSTPADAYVAYLVKSDGTERKQEGSGGVQVTIGTWLLDGVASDYEVMLQVTSGTAPNGGSAQGTYLPLSSTQWWSLTDTSLPGNALTNNCTVYIRDAVTHVVLASATVTMLADKNGPP